MAESTAKKYQIFGEFPSGGEGAGLPPVTEADNGKILKVVDGEWVAGEMDTYDEDYWVTPGERAQILKTDQKLMKRNMIVEAIPYLEVTNSSGGTTVTIGNEE